MSVPTISVFGLWPSLNLPSPVMDTKYRGDLFPASKSAPLVWNPLGIGAVRRLDPKSECPSYFSEIRFVQRHVSLPCSQYQFCLSQLVPKPAHLSTDFSHGVEEIFTWTFFASHFAVHCVVDEVLGHLFLLFRPELNKLALLKYNIGFQDVHVPNGKSSKLLRVPQQCPCGPYTWNIPATEAVSLNSLKLLIAPSGKEDESSSCLYLGLGSSERHLVPGMRKGFCSFSISRLELSDCGMQLHLLALETDAVRDIGCDETEWFFTHHGTELLAFFRPLDASVLPSTRRYCGLPANSDARRTQVWTPNAHKRDFDLLRFPDFCKSLVLLGRVRHFQLLGCTGPDWNCWWIVLAQSWKKDKEMRKIEIEIPEKWGGERMKTEMSCRRRWTEPGGWLCLALHSNNLPSSSSSSASCSVYRVNLSRVLAKQKNKGKKENKDEKVKYDS